MRSPVTGLIEQYKALTDVEQKVFLDLVDPQPEPEPAKKASKKRGPRSARAVGMSQQLSRPTSQRRCYATVDDNGGEMTCGKMEDDPVHDQSYLSSHPFAPPAFPVTRRSSRKGAGTKFIPSTAEERATVLSVSNGGD